MHTPILKQTWVVGAYLLAAASVVATHVFHAFSVAEVLAVSAFIIGFASWWLAQNVDRWIVIGAVLGLLGLLLKGLFVVFGIGAEMHDMTTHQITPGNPLLVHIHHVFFNVGFLCYFASLVRSVFSLLRRKQH